MTNIKYSHNTYVLLDITLKMYSNILQYKVVDYTIEINLIQQLFSMHRTTKPFNLSLSIVGLK
jgi:hypothetical protein